MIDDRTTKYFVDRTNIEKLRNFFDDILASPLLMIPEHNIQLSITRCTNIIKTNRDREKDQVILDLKQNSGTKNWRN